MLYHNARHWFVELYQYSKNSQNNIMQWTCDCKNGSCTYIQFCNFEELVYMNKHIGLMIESFHTNLSYSLTTAELHRLKVESFANFQSHILKYSNNNLPS